MKITINKNRTAMIGGLTETEFDLIVNIVYVADRRCFNRRNTSDGNWYSNDDFVLTLTDEQRTVLAQIGGALREILE